MKITQNIYTYSLFKNQINFTGYLKDIPVKYQKKILDQYASGDSYDTIKKMLSEVINISEASIITFIRQHDNDNSLQQKHQKIIDQAKEKTRQKNQLIEQHKTETKIAQKKKVVERTIQMVQEGGHTLDYIADTLGVSVQTIYRYLHENNDYQRYLQARLTYEKNLISEMAEKYDKGMSIDYIAQEFGYNRVTVEKYLHTNHNLDSKA